MLCEAKKNNIIFLSVLQGIIKQYNVKKFNNFLLCKFLNKKI